MKKIVALTTLVGLSLEGMPVPVTNNIIPINEQPINNVIPMVNTGIMPGINGNGNFLGGVGVGVAVPAPVPIIDNGFNGNNYYNQRDRKRSHNKRHRRRNHSRNYNDNMNDIHWDNYY